MKRSAPYAGGWRVLENRATFRGLAALYCGLVISPSKYFVRPEQRPIY
jgi:hypothetical protein